MLLRLSRDPTSAPCMDAAGVADDDSDKEGASPRSPTAATAPARAVILDCCRNRSRDMDGGSMTRGGGGSSTYGGFVAATTADVL